MTIEEIAEGCRLSGVSLHARLATIEYSTLPREQAQAALIIEYLNQTSGKTPAIAATDRVSESNVRKDSGHCRKTPAIAATGSDAINDAGTGSVGDSVPENVGDGRNVISRKEAIAIVNAIRERRMRSTSDAAWFSIITIESAAAKHFNLRWPA